nr:uncharacterized protein LOC128685191 [Cherax quadricarinatus]
MTKQSRSPLVSEEVMDDVDVGVGDIFNESSSVEPTIHPEPIPVPKSVVSEIDLFPKEDLVRELQIDLSLSDIRKLAVSGEEALKELILILNTVLDRVPALGGEQRAELRRIKQQIFPYRDPDEDLDWSLAFHKSMYYQFYTKMPTACLEVGILEVWGYDTAVIQALTDDDVLNDINTVNISATFSYPMNFTDFLGGIVKNASGYITGARTALTMLVMQTTRSRGSSMPANSAGLSEEVDMELFAWEGKYIQFLNNNTNRPQGLQVFFQSQRSFGEISGDTILGDVTFLILGNVTLFVYVQLMLGKFNMVENRPLLSLLGLLSTFMAVGVSFGLCSAMGLLYGPVHTILPLLMLGLGVDDMFVIVQCWHNLTPQIR